MGENELVLVVPATTQYVLCATYIYYFESALSNFQPEVNVDTHILYFNPIQGTPTSYFSESSTLIILLGEHLIGESRVYVGTTKTLFRSFEVVVVV